MKVLWTVSLVAIFMTAATGADTDTAPASNGATTTVSTPPSSQAAELAQLKARIAEQQVQLEQLKKVLADETQILNSLSIRAETAAAPEPTGLKVPKLGEVASATGYVPPSPGPAPKPDPFPLVPPAPQAAAAEQSSLLQLKIGDAYITPIGFMDLTNTFRSTNAGTSLQTNFGSIPYNNTTAGRLTEDKLSAANSRIGFRVDALVKDWRIMGYFEGDFVGGVADSAYNTQVSSNSLLFRIRQYYVQTRKGKFEFQAGQSWSMLTPNRKQISPLPADLFYSQVVDVNYMNGLTWGRIPGVRFVLHPSEKVTWGISLENSSQYFGGSGGGGTPALPTALTGLTSSEIDDKVVDGIKLPNVAPDIISKLAFDPSSRVHFEIAGVLSEFKLFNPNTSQYFTKVGAGGSLNGNFEIVKNFRLITNNFWSDGEGRYLFGLTPDFIVRADGSPSTIHTGSTVSGIEATVKNSLFYAYYGGVYMGRNTAFDTNGKTLIGYGYTGSANSQNKTTQEATFGLTQTLMRDGKWGALQMMYQYAYFFRDPWYVALGAPKNTHEDAIWFNMRYVLPGTPPSSLQK
jgi:hypothetical protein